MCRIIECGYHNTDKSVVILLSCLVKKVVNKVEFNTEKQINIYNKIFLDKVEFETYTLKEKRRLFEKISKLTRLAEKFLVFEALMNDESVFNDFLFTCLNKKGQKALLMRNFKKSNKSTERKPIKNLKYYELKYNKEIHQLHFLGRNTNFIKQVETGLNQLNYYADLIYILRKTSFYLNLLCSENLKLYSQHINIELILNLIGQKKQYANPHVKVNLLFIKLFKTKNDKYYKLLLALLKESSSEFLRQEVISFYSILYNYFVSQSKKGINKQEDIVKLYQLAEDQSLILEQGNITATKLKGIIVAACKTTHIEWASSFLVKYKSYIKKEIRKSVYNLNLCIIEFYKKNYETALNYAIKVETVNLDYDRNCRILILKCHFELDKEYDERTLRIFRSAEKYFRGLKLLNKKQKKMYTNFMNIFINLYKIKHRVARLSLTTIEQRLNNQQINSDKHWLLTKIEELKK